MKRILLIALLLTVLYPRASWAYIDPGTGSILLQAILAGTAAAAVVVRAYWTKLKAFFSGGPKSTTTDNPDKGTE
jgi:hypothetical protein